VSRIPRALAKRIDRAARRAHAFHRWSHHPLCCAYAGEMLRVGRARICKGCTLAGAGGLAGAVLALALPPPPGALALAGALGFAAAIRAALSLRPSGARPPKLATRALPMLLGVWAALAGLRAGGAGAVAAPLAGTALAAGIVAYRRRGPARDACAACPERATAGVCAGFRPIARREAALRRFATRWLRARGVVPR
jgi:hypothetical protein